MDSSTARRTAVSQLHQAERIAAGKVTDGTKDYQPLRSKQYDLKKVHITETPITWSNWYRHVNWLNTFFIIGIPFMGFTAAYYHPLHRWTALFSVIYYVNTGLGITAGMHDPPTMPFLCPRAPGCDLPGNFRRISPSLVPHFLQGHTASPDLSGRGRRRSGSGLHQVVVERPPRPPPVHGHGQGPVFCPEGLHLFAHRLARHEAEPEAPRPVGHHGPERGPRCRLAACALPGKLIPRLFSDWVAVDTCYCAALADMSSSEMCHLHGPDLSHTGLRLGMG